MAHSKIVRIGTYLNVSRLFVFRARLNFWMATVWGNKKTLQMDLMLYLRCRPPTFAKGSNYKHYFEIETPKLPQSPTREYSNRYLYFCFTGLDWTKQVNLLLVQHKQSSWIKRCKTGVQPYSHTYPYEVSIIFSAIFVQKNKDNALLCLTSVTPSLLQFRNS